MANRKKPEHRKLTRKLQVQLTEAEYERIEAGATEDETLSAYTRRILLDCLNEAPAATAVVEATPIIAYTDALRPQLTRLADHLGYEDADDLVCQLTRAALAQPEQAGALLHAARHAQTRLQAAAEIAATKRTTAKPDVPASTRRHSA